MMPIIPFYIITFVYGARGFFKYLYGIFKDRNAVNGLNFIFLGAAVIYSGSAYYETKNVYQDQTHHIAIRQVVTAKWLKNNTPENAVIATHDVGAIGYYSERKIVDVAGLINPEFIKKLNSKDFARFMTEQMIKEHVDYIVFLREWYRVVNQTPLFTTGDQNFEIMDVFKFDPGKTHILSGEVNGMNNYGLQMIQQKQYRQALNIFSRAAEIDPKSSLSFFYLAYAYSFLGDAQNSEKYLKRALEIYPEFHDAALALIDTYKRERNIPQAIEYAEIYLRTNPSDTTIAKILKSFSDSTGTK